MEDIGRMGFGVSMGGVGLGLDEVASINVNKFGFI